MVEDEFELISEAITINELKDLNELLEWLFSANDNERLPEMKDNFKNKAFCQQLVENLIAKTKKKNNLILIPKKKFFGLVKFFKEIFQSFEFQ